LQNQAPPLRTMRHRAAVRLSAPRRVGRNACSQSGRRYEAGNWSNSTTAEPIEKLAPKPTISAVWPRSARPERIN
jgi:hypothetical protein